MKIDQWLSLQLPADVFPVYNEGGFVTVESVDKKVIAIPRKSQLRPNYKQAYLRMSETSEEARVIATILRLMNPI